ncbi:hypothetical protein [Variovorax paradoxus]|uniref:hypothetical protein n=1 Tax=Variovorax paradoxus TaxID=34073 RepID=UPI001C12ABCF|nr:hypothetical protein [Variovorax paradoxus]
MAGIEAVSLSGFFSLASTSAEPLSKGSVLGAGEVRVKFVRGLRETIPSVLLHATRPATQGACA